MPIPNPERWVAGEILASIFWNSQTSVILDSLAGRDGATEREDSFRVLDGPAGNRYIRLPGGTTGRRPVTPGSAMNRGAFPEGLRSPRGITWDGAQYVVLNTSPENDLWILVDATDPASAVNQGPFPSDLVSPEGITWDGTQFVITDADPSGDKLWTLANVTNPASAVNRGAFSPGVSFYPDGIAWEGSQYVILDSSGVAIHTQDLWTLTDVSDPTSVVRQGSFPEGLGSPGGIAWDGTKFFIVDARNARLWTLTDVTDPGSAVNQGSFPSGLDSPAGITLNGNETVIVDSFHASLWTLGGGIGQVRWNTTLGTVEFWNGTEWESLSSTAAKVTAANLFANGSVGPGANQVAAGDHTH